MRCRAVSASPRAAAFRFDGPPPPVEAATALDGAAEAEAGAGASAVACLAFSQDGSTGEPRLAAPR